jgi:hypothetical protein
LVIRSILVADHHRASLSQARMIGFNATQKSNDVRDKKTALQPMDWIERRCRNGTPGIRAGLPKSKCRNQLLRGDRRSPRVAQYFATTGPPVNL